MSAEKLIERLQKRAKEDQMCADNSAVVADCLAGQMKLFEERAESGWNTYAVRTAVDHRNGAKRDAQYAADLNEAITTLSATQADNERLRKAMEPFAAMLHRFEAAARGFSVDPRPDSYVPRTDFTYGELRAAARALAARSALPEQEEGK